MSGYRRRNLNPGEEGPNEVLVHERTVDGVQWKVDMNNPIDPEYFLEPKKVNCHWGELWKDIPNNPLLKRWVGGEHIDKLTMPNVDLFYVFKLMKKNVAVHQNCVWQLWSLDPLTRSAIGSDEGIQIWWSTSVADSDGFIHLYVVFYPGVKVHPNNSPCRKSTCGELCVGREEGSDCELVDPPETEALLEELFKDVVEEPQIHQGGDMENPLEVLHPTVKTDIHFTPHFHYANVPAIATQKPVVDPDQPYFSDCSSSTEDFGGEQESESEKKEDFRVVPTPKKRRVEDEDDEYVPDDEVESNEEDEAEGDLDECETTFSTPPTQPRRGIGRSRGSTSVNKPRGARAQGSSSGGRRGGRGRTSSQSSNLSQTEGPQ